LGDHTSAETASLGQSSAQRKNKSKARSGLDFSRTDTEHHSGVQNAYGFQEPYRRQYALNAEMVPTYGWFADIVRTDAQIYVVILNQQPGQNLNKI